MVVAQVPADRVRPGVQATAGQLLAQRHDQLDDLRADRGRRGLRPPGPRLERRLALSLVTGQQGVDPRPGDTVGAGHLADRPLFDSDSSDDKPGFRHARKIGPGCPRCRETPVLDVLKLGTAERTAEHALRATASTARVVERPPPWRNWISAARLYRAGCRFDSGRRLDGTSANGRPPRVERGCRGSNPRVPAVPAW